MARPPLIRRSLLALALLAGVAGSVQAQDSTVIAPKPFAELSRTLLAGRDSLVKISKSQVGLKYKWGAKQPGIAFDCSALVQWIAGLFGRDLPRTAAQQNLAGVPVPKDTAQLLPGDLLMFGKGKKITHVGIYVGEGKYIHAASRRKGVIESSIDRAKPTYWKGVRRIFQPDSTLTPTPDS